MRINASAAPIGHQGTPYAIEIVNYGEGKRQVARYTCGSCGATSDVPIKPSNQASLSIEMHRRILRGRRWTMSSRADSVRCDKCQGSHKTMAKLHIPATNGAPVDVMPDGISAVAATGTATSPVGPTFTPRDPTPNDRLAIRQKLDSCFDDAAGHYLGGESDETIAKALNCPRAWVTNIREAAYGPIRENAEVIECRKLIDAISAKQTELGAQIAALYVRLEKLGG